MATSPNTNGRKLLILVGDGASPEQFAHPCSINQARSFERTANVTEEPDIDCADPGEPGWVQRNIDSLSAQITGDGRVKLEDVELFDDWFESKEAKNVKVKIDATGGRTYTGAYFLTGLTWGGPESGSMTGSFTMQSTGAVTSADNA